MLGTSEIRIGGALTEDDIDSIVLAAFDDGVTPIDPDQGTWLKMVGPEPDAWLDALQEHIRGIVNENQVLVFGCSHQVGRAEFPRLMNVLRDRGIPYLQYNADTGIDAPGVSFHGAHGEEDYSVRLTPESVAPDQLDAAVDRSEVFLNAQARLPALSVAEPTPQP